MARTLDLKGSAIGIGGTPAPMSKYGPTPRPAKDASPTQVPRASSADASGQTQGNYAPLTPPAVPGPGAQNAGRDAALTAMQENAQ